MLWPLLEVARTDERRWLDRPIAHSGGRSPRQYTQTSKTNLLPSWAGRSTCLLFWGATIGLQSMVHWISPGRRRRERRLSRASLDASFHCCADKVAGKAAKTKLNLAKIGT